MPVVSKSVDELKKLPIENRLFINGEFVPSRSGKKFDVINPTSEQIVASLLEVATHSAIKQLRYFAGKATDVQGDTSLNTPGFVNLVFRQPFGVCGAITPWNVPVTMITQKLGPALITGNTLVLKTSEKAPLSPLVIAQCCQEIGLPKGVFNILSGFGQPCGEAIARHMDIRKISFTGSTNTGRAIKKAAAESNLKNVTIELGGKSPLVIFDDADIEKAAKASAFSILFNSGQTCVASSRVFVHAKIADEFTEALKGVFAALGTSNDPLATGTFRGPQADRLQSQRIMEYMNGAKAEGLEIVTGGNRERDTGYFIQPTIIKNAPEDSKVFKEEIFGPVMCLNVFEDEEKVLQSANNTEFGLYASVFTKDISRALRISKKFEALQPGLVDPRTRHFRAVVITDQ
ncbi:putative aldehyde dehydrogenase [Ilyonectria robusta]